MAYAHKKNRLKSTQNNMFIASIISCFQYQMLCGIAALYRLAHQTYVPRKALYNREQCGVV